MAAPVGVHPFSQTAVDAALAADAPIAAQAAQAVTGVDSIWRLFKNVSSANSPASPALLSGQSAVLSDPLGRAGTTYAFVRLVAETLVAPTATSVTMTVAQMVGSTVTTLLTKVIPLGTLPAVNNTVDILGLTSTNNAIVRVPLGAALQISTSSGTFNFFANLALVPA